MPRHHETAFLLRRAFPAPEKAGKIGQAQPSDHPRTGEEAKRAAALPSSSSDRRREKMEME